MKRLLLALSIASASLLTLSSCTKEYITNYLPGVSYVYEVKSNQWSLTSTANTYVYEQRIADLDDRYFQDGHVSVAISYDSDDQTYEIIPAVIRDDVNEEHYSFSANYSRGVVRIFAEDIGYSPSIQAPAGMFIKIVLTDAEIGN